MLKENNVITLDSGERYLLLHELENVEGKNYFYAIGVQDDDNLDKDDLQFFEVSIEDGEELVEVVDPETELFKTLTAIEFIDSKIDEDPSYEKYLDEIMNTQTSSN